MGGGWNTHLFTLRRHLTYWSTLKIANDLPIFASYYAFVVVSLTWLAYFLSHDYLLYKFTRFFNLFFCFSLTKGQWRAKTLDYTICIGSTPTFLYFDLYLYSAYATHYLYEENGVYCIVLYSNCYLFACVPTGTCLCQCTVCVSLVFRHMYNF